MRRLAALVLASSLAACISDNDAQIAQCQRELARDHPNVAKEPRTFYRAHGEYMLLCMKAGGFAHDVSPAKCDPEAGSIFDNPYCYVPAKAWPRWLLRAELFLSR
jgi:hypothetical protein